MKRTIINYKAIDRFKIEIVDFKNVATKNEIFLELGLPKFLEYTMGGINYYGYSDMIKITSPIKMPTGSFVVVKRGDILTNQAFKHLIKKMKEAGNRYSELRIAATSVQEVKI